MEHIWLVEQLTKRALEFIIPELLQCFIFTSNSIHDDNYYNQNFIAILSKIYDVLTIVISKS